MKTLGLMAFAVMMTGCWDALDLSGDKTHGEEGTSVWWISDGLCPGLVGECALDTPIALNAAPTLEMQGEEASLIGLTLAGEGGLTLGETTLIARDSADEDSRDMLSVRARATSVGQATVRLMAADDEIDRVRAEVAQPAAIECGTYMNEGALHYTMENISFSSRVEILIDTSGGSSDTQLVCRVTDAGGRALLTVRAIQWEIVDGAEVVLLDSDDFAINPSATAAGARIRVQTLATGTARVRASIAGISTDLEVVVTN